jgi:hypothetical protein
MVQAQEHVFITWCLIINIDTSLWAVFNESQKIFCLCRASMLLPSSESATQIQGAILHFERLDPINAGHLQLLVVGGST